MKPKYDGLHASLVWDGDDKVRVPPEAGTPREDQMLGTVSERLAEVSGRACYDSMGKNGSRSSANYHPHIIGVGHGSVFGHWHGTFQSPWDWMSVERRYALLKALVGRPGIYVNLAHANELRFTTNLRSVSEWPKWTKKFAARRYYDEITALGAEVVQHALYRQCDVLAPQVMKALETHKRRDPAPPPVYSGHPFGSLPDTFSLVPPENDLEKWISIYLEGSRGLTHEECRHGHATGISMRSTRFCDESGSPWIVHPLLQEFLVDESVPLDVRENVRLATAEAESAGKSAYDQVVDKLQPWCMARIPESDEFRKTTARKQARGAGRGWLGNGLKTLGVFSATVDEWLWKFSQRGANAADGEIRAEYVMEILPVLKTCRYASHFAHLDVEPATDGVGLVLKGGGNA